MVLGIVYFKFLFYNISKRIRFLYHQRGSSFIVFPFAFGLIGTYLIRDPLSYFAFRNMEINNKKRIQIREDEIK